MEDFKVVNGHQDSAWKLMNRCELEQPDGTTLRITTMGCPTIKLGTLIQTITDIIKDGETISSSANLYHVPVSRLKPQKDEQNEVCGYILISETEPH